MPKSETPEVELELETLLEPLLEPKRPASRSRLAPLLALAQRLEKASEALEEFQQWWDEGTNEDFDRLNFWPAPESLIASMLGVLAPKLKDRELAPGVAEHILTQPLVAKMLRAAAANQLCFVRSPERFDELEAELREAVRAELIEDLGDRFAENARGEDSGDA